jgi:prepilin-type N-terminal cleavage/methylation domain-containing protein
VRAKGAYGGTGTKSVPFLCPETGGGAQRQRAGFTLVEVIVVLVILAILAAIAIPALTGYIDKAQWKTLESQVRTQRIAVQTMIIEEMTSGKLSYTGDTVTYPTDGDRYFSAVNKATVAFRNVGAVMLTPNLTSYGKQEYAALTGDAQSFAIADRRIYAYFDASGTVMAYSYQIPNYFGDGVYLWAWYVVDSKIITPLQTQYNLLPNFTVGMNIYKYTNNIMGEKLN